MCDGGRPDTFQISCSRALLFVMLPLNAALCSPEQGYPEGAVYNEHEGIPSAPAFGSGIVGEACLFVCLFPT